jgi:hypothetical protein
MEEVVEAKVNRIEEDANVSLIKFLKVLMKQDFYGNVELNFRNGIFTTLEQFKRTMNIESIRMYTKAYDKMME